MDYQYTWKEYSTLIFKLQCGMKKSTIYWIRWNQRFKAGIKRKHTFLHCYGKVLYMKYQIGIVQRPAKICFSAVDFEKIQTG